ncbi:MAG TPA: copper chaperone [Bacteroidetes bacterium]|nr:copper chaperone [Bacteroidota bacterium]
MKTRTIFLTVFFLSGASALFAQERKEKFEVKGNCGMCETRIEKAAGSVEGVRSADWSQESKMLELTFDPAKASLDDIQKKIASVGHDTPLHRAKDEVYNNLPACCKYERAIPEKKSGEK